MGIHEMEGKMCKGNDILQKVKWHGEEKNKSGGEKRAKSQKGLVRILA